MDREGVAPPKLDATVTYPAEVGKASWGAVQPAGMVIRSDPFEKCSAAAY
jgi:hypothetical protein